MHQQQFADCIVHVGTLCVTQTKGVVIGSCDVLEAWIVSGWCPDRVGCRFSSNSSCTGGISLVPDVEEAPTLSSTSGRACDVEVTLATMAPRGLAQGLVHLCFRAPCKLWELVLMLRKD